MSATGRLFSMITAWLSISPLQCLALLWQCLLLLKFTQKEEDFSFSLVLSHRRVTWLWTSHPPRSLVIVAICIIIWSLHRRPSCICGSAAQPQAIYCVPFNQPSLSIGAMIIILAWSLQRRRRETAVTSQLRKHTLHGHMLLTVVSYRPGHRATVYNIK